MNNIMSKPVVSRTREREREDKAVSLVLVAN